MALSIGTVKQVIGLVMAKNAEGVDRVLKVGDVVNFEDTIRTMGAGSQVVLALADGQEISLAGNDDIFLDKSVYVAENFGEEAIVSSKTVDGVVSGKSVEELQAALLEGKDPNALEATAAGGEGGTINAGMTDNAMAQYVTGGTESNVIADYRTLGGAGAGDVTYVAPGVIPAETTVVAVNNPPLGGDDAIVTNEDVAITATVPVATDVDGDVVTYGLATGTQNGALVFNPDGSYTYTPNENFNGSDNFTYTITDSNGASNTYTVAITVDPVNDPATVSSASHTFTEDDASLLSTSGTLTILDVDAGEAYAVAQTAGVYGTFSVDANGNWSYSADNTQTAIQQLGTVGGLDSLTETFTVNSLDGTGSGTVTIVINGNNDIATVSSASHTFTEDEAGTLNTGGTLTILDVDAGEAYAVAQTAGVYGTFSVDANGNWSYSADNTQTAIQQLGTVGGLDSLTETFTVNSLDGTGSGTVTIVINGNNDIATVSSASHTFTEDEAGTLNTGGTLTILDVDAGEAYAVAQTAGVYGTFSVDANGNWSYSADNTQTAIQQLGTVGGLDSLTETFTVNSLDGTGSGTVTIVINGNNDIAAVTNDTRTVQEDVAVSANMLSTSGQVFVTDVDSGEAYAVAQGSKAGLYGTFTVDVNGNWTYAADNTQDVIQQLGATGSLTDTLSVTSLDGTGLGTVTVTINGTNDGPVAEAKYFTTAEDTPLTITNAQLLAGATDIDTGDVLSITNVALKDPTNGTLVDNGNGTYTFNPNHDYSGTAVELTYTITDHNGGTDTENVTINVTPVADAPILDVYVGPSETTYVQDPNVVYNLDVSLNKSSYTTGILTTNGYANQIDLTISSYKTGVDEGNITLYLYQNNVPVDIYTVNLDTLISAQYGSINNQPTTLHIQAPTNQWFDGVEIRNIDPNANSEYKVDSVTALSVMSVSYPIDLSAALSDGSELLSDVSLAFPSDMHVVVYENDVAQDATIGTDGLSYYTVASNADVWFATDHQLSTTEINSIYSNLTSTEQADGYATTVENALNEVPGTVDDDNLFGSTGDDHLDGDAGNDILSGNSGDDNLDGGAGTDALYGEAGDDMLDGGVGSDALYGGADNDTLVYDGLDTAIDGGAGLDSLLIKDSTVDFSSINDAKIENIEVLDLSRSDVSLINLNPNDVFEITDNSSTILKIIGDSGDSVASTDPTAWAPLADQTGVDTGFTRYEGTLDDGVTKVMVDIQDTVVHTDFD